MYPYPLRFFGIETAVWDVAFLLGALAGYPLWRRALRWRTGGARGVGLPLRWLVVVYLGALSAQLLAYLVDLNTTVLPPPSVGWLRYYWSLHK